jgi:hypothetical protein
MKRSIPQKYSNIGKEKKIKIRTPKENEEKKKKNLKRMYKFTYFINESKKITTTCTKFKEILCEEIKNYINKNINL